jgi:hypothetical protein
MAQIILDSNNNLIQGDFDNATLNNRTKLQTTTTNATTNVYVAPNGSATSAGVSVANNSSLTNASKIVMATNGSTDTQIISGINGSGTYLPLSFYTNNALAAQIDTSGRLLLPSQPAFKAYTSSDTTLATDTAIVFNLTQFNRGSNYSTTTGRFTAPVAGAYLFTAGALFSGMSAGQIMEISLVVNSSITQRSTRNKYQADYTGYGGYIAGQTIATVLYLNANDYVTIVQTSGNTYTLYGNAEGSWSFFTGTLLG